MSFTQITFIVVWTKVEWTTVDLCFFVTLCCAFTRRNSIDTLVLGVDGGFGREFSVMKQWILCKINKTFIKEFNLVFIFLFTFVDITFKWFDIVVWIIRSSSRTDTTIAWYVTEVKRKTFKFELISALTGAFVYVLIQQKDISISKEFLARLLANVFV